MNAQTFLNPSQWHSVYSAKLWRPIVRVNRSEIVFSEFFNFPLRVLIPEYSNMFLYDLRYSVQILRVWLNKPQQSPTEISTGFTLVSEYKAII